MQQLVDNRYRLVDTLGSGGMADVYLAHDDILDRPLALKVLSSRYAQDEEFIERFRREAQNAASLSHPNIVSIFDRGETEDGTYYIAMEYLPGGTLKDRLVERGPLPARTAAAVALQIAEALRAAHNSDVVHRDIKPHNILITESGDIKVTDFGIARAASSSTMTKTGSILGTAQYLSPEQAMGEPVRPQSDLYSLGVVLYEMLTGELPYNADTPIGIAMKHVNGELRPPVEVDPSIPAGINAVVMRLLARHPEDRYADAAALIKDLERVSAGLEPEDAGTRQMTRVMPPVPPPPPPRSPKGDDGRQRPQVFAPVFLALLALAVLAGLGWLAYNLLQDTQQEVPQPTPPAMLEVPELEGMKLEEARQEFGEDFDIVETRQENSNQAENTILSQTPEAGGQREKGSEIGVVTASGQNGVPDVEGMGRQEARQTLEEAGFKVKVTEGESTAEQEGKIISQDPGAGATVDVGSEVEITAGTGPALVEVPNLYGYTLDEAAVTLQNVGLQLGGHDTIPSDEVAEGGIIYQSELPGDSVEPGTFIGVTISSGPETVTVPDVVGQDVKQAKKTIADAGFYYAVSRTPSRQQPKGKVIKTDPAAGTEVQPGSTISIVVSSGPPKNNNGGNQGG